MPLWATITSAVWTLVSKCWFKRMLLILLDIYNTSSISGSYFIFNLSKKWLSHLHYFMFRVWVYVFQFCYILTNACHFPVFQISLVLCINHYHVTLLSIFLIISDAEHCSMCLLLSCFLCLAVQMSCWTFFWCVCVHVCVLYSILNNHQEVIFRYVVHFLDSVVVQGYQF